MAANNLANTKAEVFASVAQKELKESSNLVQFVEDHSNKAVKGVNVVSIPKLSSFTVQDRAFGAAASENTPLIDSVDQIPLDKNKIVKWSYDAADAMQSSLEYQLSAIERGGSAHGRAVNAEIVTVWETVAGFNPNGAVPADITVTNILSMRQFLLQNFADMTKVALIIAADQEAALLALPEFSRYDYRGNSPIVNGMIGTVYGVPVYISQAVKAQQAFMVEKSGSGIAIQRDAKYGEQPDLDYGVEGKKSAIDMTYGLGGLQLGEGLGIDNATPIGATLSPLIAKLTD